MYLGLGIMGAVAGARNLRDTHARTHLRALVSNFHRCGCYSRWHRRITVCSSRGNASHYMLVRSLASAMRLLSSDLVHPKDTKIIKLPPVSSCHKCRNHGAYAAKVSIRDKIVIVWEPCFECDSILHRALFLGPTAGPSFDFALDLELANAERPPRSNPRIT
jgi:hypothetical protein